MQNFALCCTPGRENRRTDTRQLLLMIKLTAILLFAFSLSVSARVVAQNVTLNLKNATLEKVFFEIEKQTGFNFVYNTRIMNSAKPVTILVNDVAVDEVLKIVFKDQPLNYQLKEKTIVITAKATVLLNSELLVAPPLDVKGVVRDESGKPAAGVSVMIKGTTRGTSTNERGEFSLTAVPENSLLVFSSVNMKTFEVKVTNDKAGDLAIMLKAKISELADVVISTVNTGYQQIPKERATGSFVYIDSNLLNRKVSTDIINRLEGISSGVSFNAGFSSNLSRPRNESLGISIRGRSTIDQSVNANPLIVVDNFPFEGDVNSINPNTIESITLLKDAAAASIWGARAGNGVIVITTKKGKRNQPLQVSLNSNFTLGEKPDLNYSRKFLDSKNYIDVETFLFNQGFFNSDLSNATTRPVVSPVVEILNRRKLGLITSADSATQLGILASIDNRKIFLENIYRTQQRQQYSLTMQGGGNQFSSLLTIGFDKNLDNLIRNNYQRITLNTFHSYSPSELVELTLGVTYNDSQRDNNTSPDYSNLNTGNAKYGMLFPYQNIVDDYGNSIATPRTYRMSYVDSMRGVGFLDWRYRPMDEIRLSDNSTKIGQIIIRSSFKYKFLSYANFEFQYQFEKQNTFQRIELSPETFYTRDLINRFSQKNSTGVFTYIIPQGGILSMTNSDLFANNLRAQFNVNKIFASRHSINVIAGAEVREIKSTSYTRLSYGYLEDFGTSVNNLNFGTTYPTYPAGSNQLIPAPTGSVSGTTNRFISYYTLGSYTYDNKYVFSFSARKDGANIFGVNTNDKITPLWSLGGAWELSKERFYKISWLPYTRFRVTYGFNGNVYNASAYLTASYGTSSLTGFQTANVVSPPNPSLRWERNRNINVGIDFKLFKNIINGSVEWFNKDGRDLIESAPLAPQTGFTSFKGNAASMKTSGIDFAINFKNIQKGSLRWETATLISILNNRVTSFDNAYTARLLLLPASGTAEFSGVIPVVGRPMFGIYAFKWAGLDTANGDPQGYLGGKISKDYVNILANTPIDSLTFFGSSRPTFFGSVRNTFTWKHIELSFNITWKASYYFRRVSIGGNYSDQLVSPNIDYSNRWQKPGDESYTNILSVVYPSNTSRTDFYAASEALVEKGDHIRFQDIGISYEFNRENWKRIPIPRIQFYLYAYNLGVIWRANKHGIDPDFVDNGSSIVFPNQKTLSVGIRANF
jgi:TonB-linked SusC/RagA family outer membrane protein